MCWNITSSAILASTGTSISAYGWHKKQPIELILALLYFTSMELLQALQYIWINLCGNPYNELFTILGYIHIIFQPFIINMLMMHFIDPKKRSRIFRWVYAITAIGSASMIMELYPFSWTHECTSGLLCGKQLCTMSGIWHLKWNIPLNNLFTPIPTFFPIPLGYVLTGLLLPFFYGAWKPNIMHILFGPGLAWILVGSRQEGATIWCAVSIFLIIAIVWKKPFRQYLYS